MHFWHLSYTDYRALPVDLYNIMATIQKEESDKAKKQRR